MFTHVMVGSNDIERSRRFYEATLGALGMTNLSQTPARAYFMKDGLGFGVGTPWDGKTASFGNGITIGFGATDSQQVDGFHAAGVANGGTDAGAPGPRPMGPGQAYGAYLRDPDGNKICAYSDMPSA